MKQLNEVVSEHAKKSEFMKPPKRGRGTDSPGIIGRHEKFQFGGNPMEMTPFEKELAYKEKMERELAKQVYVRGVQGPDGGRCVKPEFQL